MLQTIKKRPRPQITFGTTRRFDIGDRTWYGTINVAEDGSLFEVFLKGASDPIAQEQQEFMGKMVSLLLRFAVAPERIIKALLGIKSVPTFNGGELMESVPDALAKILRERMNKGSSELLMHFENPQIMQGEMIAPSQPEMVARPQVIPSKNFTFKIGQTTHRLIVTLHHGNPFEVWAMADEQGSESRAFHEALGRLVSIALRMEIPVEVIADELIGVKSTPTVNIIDGQPVVLSSATDATGRFLLEVANITPPALIPAATGSVRDTEHYISTMRDGITEMVPTARGKVYVTLTFDENVKPIEVTAALGKAGDEEGALLEYACRSTSAALQAGVDIDTITSMGAEITTSPMWHRQDDGSKSVLILSVPHAVTYVISKHAQGAALTMV